MKAKIVTEIPKENIGLIIYNGKLMAYQTLIGQYCYVPGEK